MIVRSQCDTARPTMTTSKRLTSGRRREALPNRVGNRRPVLPADTPIFDGCTKSINKRDMNDAFDMRGDRVLSTVVFLSLVLAAMLALPGNAEAATDDEGITYTVDPGVVTVTTPNVTVQISTTIPAVIVWNSTNTSEPGNGFLFSTILGYNTTLPDGLVLDQVPYHATFDTTVWTPVGPSLTSDPELGDVLTMEMVTTVDMNKRLAFSGGNPEPGTPGIEVIEDWATVTAKFIVTEESYSAAFDADDSPEYPVNGSTEVKFDISIEIHVPIDADSLALDMSLMKMDSSVFGPSLEAESYLFRGYQDTTVTVSDPAVNETDGEELIMHTFDPRDGCKQLFEFVDINETGFFGWADEALMDWSNADPDLVDVTTYYRTDGEALKVYVATPLQNETELITHDPSVGAYISSSGGGYVPLPGGGSIVGSSVASIAIGMLIGVAVAGATGAYIAVRNLSKEDPADLVRLEKNRYYRKK